MDSARTFATRIAAETCFAPTTRASGRYADEIPAASIRFSTHSASPMKGSTTRSGRGSRSAAVSESEPERGAVRAGPRDVRAGEEAGDRRLSDLGVDLAVVLVLHPRLRRVVE